MPDPPFINYSHPSEQSNPRNRRKVASYIGTHYRNRSKPSARNALKKAEPLVSKFTKTAFVDQDSSNIETAVLPFRKRGSRQSSPSQSGDSPFARLLSPTLSHDKHGFRSDPFDAYPIDSRACIPTAIDFFLGFYGPTHIIRPEVLSAQTGTIILRQYFQYAVQNSLMFEAIVALSQANLTIHSWTSKGPDKDALYHYSRAVHRLRALLTEQHGYTQDCVLFAIVALMGVDYLLNDLAAFEMHLGGLRRIVALRGGLDQLGWPQILKPYLIGLESFWAYISKTQAKVPDKQEKTAALSEIFDDLDLTCPYTREPVSGLDEMISALPLGFQNLALNYRLGVPVITLIHRVTTKAHYINQVVRLKPTVEINAANLQEAEYCVRLLACTDLTIIERACCIGGLVAIVDCTRSEKFSPLYVQQIRHHCAELLLWQARFDDTDLAEYFLWVALDMVGSMFPPRVPSVPTNYRDDKRFELLMATVKKYEGLEWDDVEIIMKKFFFTQPCLESWENAWRLGKAEMQKQQSPQTHKGEP